MKEDRVTNLLLTEIKTISQKKGHKLKLKVTGDVKQAKRRAREKEGWRKKNVRDRFLPVEWVSI